MCFAPQGCTFSTCQLPKVSETVSFLNFWLGNVLHATRVHFFDISTSKVVRRWCVLYILTWKCASGHNGVQLFISHLTTWLRTRRFSEPTFRPSGATNHWKNTVFSDFPTFSHSCFFFLLTLTLLWSSLFGSSPPWLFPPLLFHLSILSEVWLLNFIRWYTNILTQYPMCVCVYMNYINLYCYRLTSIDISEAYLGPKASSSGCSGRNLAFHPGKKWCNVPRSLSSKAWTSHWMVIPRPFVPQIKC